MPESELVQSTRRSMKKHFPMGAITSLTNDNPVTLHNVDDQLFARVWSVMAETMCVTMELSRTTKEGIATLVSERNTCPVCINVHTMCSVLSMVVDTQVAAADPLASADSLGTSSVSGSNHEQSKKKTKQEDYKKKVQHEQALQYAETLLDELNHYRRESCGTTVPSSNASLNSGISSRNLKKKGKKNKQKYSYLNKVAKAEVALIVMFYDHINRVVSVILGGELSTAMFSMPRSLAKAMEKPSTMRLVAKLISPLISGTFKTKNEPGMTRGLFRDEVTKPKPLPPQLKSLALAGLERANAVSRLVDWVETFEKETLIGEDIIKQDHIDFLDNESKVSRAHCHFESPQHVLHWVENTVADEISAELQELYDSDNFEVVLLLATYAPQTAFQNTYWYALVDQVGQEKARSIVVWWSLRSSLNDAKGLDTEIDAKSMRKLLASCA